MNNHTRMALPVEVDLLKLTARVNELEHQVEVLKASVKPLMDYWSRGDIDDLKPLINPNLFHDDGVINELESY